MEQKGDFFITKTFLNQQLFSTYVLKKDNKINQDMVQSMFKSEVEDFSQQEVENKNELEAKFNLLNIQDHLTQKYSTQIGFIYDKNEFQDDNQLKQTRKQKSIQSQILSKVTRDNKQYSQINQKLTTCSSNNTFNFADNNSSKEKDKEIDNEKRDYSSQFLKHLLQKQQYKKQINSTLIHNDCNNNHSKSTQFEENQGHYSQSFYLKKEKTNISSDSITINSKRNSKFLTGSFQTGYFPSESLESQESLINAEIKKWNKYVSSSLDINSKRQKRANLQKGNNLKKQNKISPSILNRAFKSTQTNNLKKLDTKADLNQDNSFLINNKQQNILQYLPKQSERYSQQYSQLNKLIDRRYDHDFTFYNSDINISNQEQQPPTLEIKSIHSYPLLPLINQSISDNNQVKKSSLTVRNHQQINFPKGSHSQIGKQQFNDIEPKKQVMQKTPFDKQSASSLHQAQKSFSDYLDSLSEISTQEGIKKYKKNVQNIKCSNNNSRNPQIRSVSCQSEYPIVTDYWDILNKHNKSQKSNQNYDSQKRNGQFKNNSKQPVQLFQQKYIKLFKQINNQDEQLLMSSSNHKQNYKSINKTEIHTFIKANQQQEQNNDMTLNINHHFLSNKIIRSQSIGFEAQNISNNKKSISIQSSHSIEKSPSIKKQILSLLPQKIGQEDNMENPNLNNLSISKIKLNNNLNHMKSKFPKDIFTPNIMKMKKKLNELIQQNFKPLS